MSWLCSLAELWGGGTSSLALPHDGLSRQCAWWEEVFIKFGWMSRDELNAEAVRQREAAQELLRKSGEFMSILREMMPFGPDAVGRAQQVRHHQSSARYPHARPPVRSEPLSQARGDSRVCRRLATVWLASAASAPSSPGRTMTARAPETGALRSPTVSKLQKSGHANVMYNVKWRRRPSSNSVRRMRLSWRGCSSFLQMHSSRWRSRCVMAERAHTLNPYTLCAFTVF